MLLFNQVYPADPDGAKPLTYHWVRTVNCPRCVGEIPLLKSYWLDSQTALLPHIFDKFMLFDLYRPEPKELRGPVTEVGVVCPFCGAVTSFDDIRLLLAEQWGGKHIIRWPDHLYPWNRASGARLLAVETRPTFTYRLPTDADYRAVWQAETQVHDAFTELLPQDHWAVQHYGAQTVGDLYTARQKLLLIRLEQQAQQNASIAPVLHAIRRNIDLHVHAEPPFYEFVEVVWRMV